MEKSKIKLIAGVVLQFPANFELEVVRDENGQTYFPVMQAANWTVPPSGTTVKTPTTPVEKVATAPTEAGKFTESELEDMEVADLMKLLIKKGVDPDQFEGKNTNKKLRTLFLQKQAGEPLAWGTAAPAAPATPAPKAKAAPVAKESEIPPSEFEGEEVEIADLESGDEVDVYWSGELNAWFKGVVVSAKGGNKTVKYYADNAKEVLDPSVHTKIIRIKDV